MHTGRSTTATVLIALVGLASIGTAVGLAIPGALAAGRLLTFVDEAHTEKRELSIPHKADSPVKVETANGTIKLIRGGTDTVSVRAMVRSRSEERAKQIKVTAERTSEGELIILAKFPDGRARDRDGVSFEIYLPDAKNITLESSNGAIEASGFAGKAELTTSNGTISLGKHVGEAILETSNGAIMLDDVQGSVHAETSNGAIKLKEVGSPVTADTSNGAIEVMLRNDAAGPVHLETSNGRVVFQAGSSFQGTLEADTSNGSVTIQQGSAPWKVTQKKTSAKVIFSEQGEKSVIDTSNGGITVSAKSGQ